ncbi:hypothetical protein [Streptomyces youssoufiensis]
MTSEVATAHGLFAAQRRALDEIVTRMPYNSATHYHEYHAARAVPAAFGASCAWQSFAAGSLVARRTGVRADYLADGRHVAAVYRTPERVTVLDPYLLHRAPLRLERAAAVDGRVRVTVAAYPLRERADGTPAPSLVTAVWSLADGAVRLAYARYSPRRGTHVLARSFTLRPHARLSRVPPPPERIRAWLQHPEQLSVSFRVVHPLTHRMAELILPLAPAGGAPVTRAALLSRDNQGAVSPYGSPGFRRDAAVVADAVGAPVAELAAFLLEAAALRRAAAPGRPALAAYGAESE